MSDRTAYEIDLKPAMEAFLNEIVAAYKLEDRGKAIRCLINYAREHGDKRDEIFSDVRCLDC